MFCPECRLEYREGFTRCSDCDVGLVWQLPKPSEPDLELVKVFETGNPALIGVIESLLDDAEIDFLTKGAGIQELIGGGRFGTGVNTVLGWVEFWVREDQESAARELIHDFAEPGAEVEPLDDHSATVDDDAGHE
jgi:Putative prokaryotic signal transducing protein